MIDQSICVVYQQDNKVIIPDFGALIYSEVTEDVDFNDILTFDDGKVIAEIQKQQNLSEEEAQNALSEYVKDIVRTLDQGKSFFFDGIGYLDKDDQDSYSFRVIQPSSDLVNEDESREFEETVSDELNEQSENSDNISDFDLDENKELKESEIEAESSQIQEDWDKMDLGEELIHAENSLEFPSEEEENSDKDGGFSYKPILSEEDEDVQEYYNRKEEFYDEGKKRNPYVMAMWIIIPLLLLGSSAYYYFNYYTPGVAQDKDVLDQPYVSSLSSEKVSPKKPTEQANETSAKPSGKDEKESSSTPSKAEVPISRKQANPAVSSSVVESPTSHDVATEQNKTYSLILGSFKVEDNADRLRQRLNEQGMEVSKFQRGNNFYFVGFEHIEGKSNAVRMLTKFKNEEPAAWIIRS